MRAWWVIACAGFLFSVLAKALADTFLRAPLPIAGSWLGLDYATNPGIAFGIALPPVLQPVLIGLAFCTLLLFRRLWLPHPFCRIGMGLILGGGAANILDRLRDGRVTDFLVLWPFPLFNVADVLITFGAVLLLGGELRHPGELALARGRRK